MPLLRFAFLPSQSSNDHQVRVLIDDRDIVESIDKGMLGLDPTEFFSQPSLRSSGELLIGRCGCGCVGCCDAKVEAVRTEDHVIWRSDYAWMKEIDFDRVQFDRSIDVASRDTSWETIERRVERLIGFLDFSVFAQRGMRFDWASARFDNQTIRLSFQRGAQQEMLSVSWDHRNEAAALVAVKELIESQGA